MSNGVYNKGKLGILGGSFDLLTDTLVVLLVKSTYVFSADDHFISDLAASEISVSGYARQTLTSKTVTEDDVNDFAYLDADDVTFAGMAAGQTIGGAVLAYNSGSDATSMLIGFYDLTDLATGSGSVIVTWASVANGGVFKGA